MAPRNSPGVELNHRFRRIRTTCFRYTTRRNRDGQNRTDFLVYPRHAGDRCPSSRKLTDPCGIRTQPGQSESLATSPEVERAAIVLLDSDNGLEGARILLSWSSARR